jgi:hypothetical protein
MFFAPLNDLQMHPKKKIRVTNKINNKLDVEKISETDIYESRQNR